MRTKISTDIFQKSQSKLGQSLPDFVFVYLTSIYPLTKRLKDLAVEMDRMKRQLNCLETTNLFIQQKITEKVGFYTNNT